MLKIAVCIKQIPLIEEANFDATTKTIKRDGLMATFAAMGGTVLANACGPCIGQWKRADVRRDGDSAARLFADAGARILECYRVLRKGGAFLVYQFTPKARDFMARHFRHIDEGFEWLNVLPCRLYWGWKED